jgi:hypothetical protein
MHPREFLHGVGSFCRILHARMIRELGVQGGNENICKIRQLFTKRCDQKKLCSCFGIMHVPRFGSNVSRLLLVILIFLWPLGTLFWSVAERIL